MATRGCVRGPSRAWFPAEAAEDASEVPHRSTTAGSEIAPFRWSRFVEPYLDNPIYRVPATTIGVFYFPLAV